MDAVARSDILAIRGLGEKWLADTVPNQGIRMNELLDVVIGERTYSAAKALWRRLHSAAPDAAAPEASEVSAPA